HDAASVISANMSASAADAGEYGMPSTRARKKTKAAPKSRAQKWVYLFAGGKAEGNANMRALLGGKGAGLAEMTNAGLPVPPGFTIATEACNAYFGSHEQLPPGLREAAAERRAASGEAGGKRAGG